MPYVICGLGNPGEEYENTRHNTGRMALEHFRKKAGFPDWVKDKKLNALVSEVKIKKEKVKIICPETFMNNSGKSVAVLVKSKKTAEELIVVHDDLDLPLGAMKISFNRGSGGHRGVESVRRAIKTEAFVRLRIGISPSTPSGKPKKPSGDKKILDFIIGNFKPAELATLKKVLKRASEALEMLVAEGRERAMGEYN